MSLPRPILDTIKTLAGPYASFPIEAKVNLPDRIFLSLDNMLKRIKEKPSYFNAKFFSTWNQQTIQFNHQLQAAFSQMKDKKDLISLQQLCSLAKEAPKDLLSNQELELFVGLRKIIRKLTVEEKQQQMQAVAQGEIKKQLEIEFKHSKINQEYLQIIQQIIAVEVKLEKQQEILASQENCLQISIEEYVVMKNQEAENDAFYNGDPWGGGNSKPTQLKLYKKGSHHWLDEEDCYENHPENEEILEGYQDYLRQAEQGIAPIKDTLSEIETQLRKIHTQRSQIEKEFQLADTAYWIAKRLMNKKEPWDQLKIFLDARQNKESKTSAADEFLQSVCQRLEKAFKLISMSDLQKTAAFQHKKPSAPKDFSLTDEVEDEFQPGLRKEPIQSRAP